MSDVTESGADGQGPQVDASGGEPGLPPLAGVQRDLLGAHFLLLSRLLRRSARADYTGFEPHNLVERRLVLTLSNQTDSATGSVLSADEGLEIPIATISQNASSLTLVVKAIGGSYSGALNQDGTAMVGTWTQGPTSLPLTFRRAAK